MTQATIYSRPTTTGLSSLEIYRRLHHQSGPRSLRKVARYLAEYCHDHIFFEPDVVVKGVHVNFYCKALKIAIEVDGYPIWKIQQVVDDMETDDYLLTWQITILRIDGNDVLRNWLDTCAQIRDTVAVVKNSQNPPTKIALGNAC